MRRLRDEIAKRVGRLRIGAKTSGVVVVSPREHSGTVDRATFADVRRGSMPNQDDACRHAWLFYRPAERAGSSATIPKGSRVLHVSGECSPLGTSKYRTG